MKTYCVATAIIHDGDKYFIARRAKSKKIAPDLWEFITGFVEDHEAAEDTILRELQEEISATGTIEKELDIIQMNTGEERWIIVPFLVSVADNTIKTDPIEHSAGMWVSWDELREIPDAEFRYDLALLETPLSVSR